MLAPPGFDFADIDKKLSTDNCILLNSKGIKHLDQEQKKKAKENMEEFRDTQELETKEHIRTRQEPKYYQESDEGEEDFEENFQPIQSTLYIKK